ncbi:MAG TPA: cell envelope integrity protein TolA [Acidobacteriaceae bacterium]|nr:cell envelope integrity protein TolA [Acidobacteriaceae bacterium]
MPILQLPTRPPRETDPEKEDAPRPVRVRTGRYGELEEHELIHLLDSIDDERARARFRESVYISLIIWLAVAWFLFYGPHVLFHQPYYRDPIAMMKQHDQELTYITPKAPPALKTPPRIDRKTMEALRQEELARKITPPAPPAPQTPAPQQPTPPEVAHNVTPPVAQPPLPLPASPKPAPSPSAPLPSAPTPNFAQNQSPQNSLQQAMRGAMRGGSGLNAPGSSAGPLQAGATILSDTQGVDFSNYMRRLHADIERNWTPLIPEEVEPPLRKRGIVGIRFSILPGGQIGDIKLETTSGDVALDKAAWYAITSEGQFPPLPPAFHGPSLDLRVGFFYNEQPE